MEQEKTEELLAKYFEGETTEEEESRLMQLLRSGSLPDSILKEYGYLSGMSGDVPEPSEGFGEGLEQLTHRESVLQPSTTRYIWLAGMSAAIALIAGLWLIFFNTGNLRNRDTFTDPAIAMNEVRSILLTVSERMNTGTTQLGKVGTIAARPEELNGLSAIGDVVGRNLSRLKYLEEASSQANKTETKIKNQ